MCLIKEKRKIQIVGSDEILEQHTVRPDAKECMARLAKFYVDSANIR